MVMEIRVASLSKSFGVTAAVNDVSSIFGSGELVALLGPSGSGKTTLLRMIAGLEFPNSGQIFFGNEDTSAWPIQKRRVGFVFQHYALFQHMTVADNIAFGLSVRSRDTRPDKKEIDARVRKLLELIQLPGIESRYPSQLSGGQRQRIALARALAIEPNVLLLDEPFGALDAKVRKDLRGWLREIHHRTGLTTLFVTHDQEEALELADRIIVLNHGRIEQVGTPDEIFDSPESAFVHDFIGESSQLLARATDGVIRVGDTMIGPSPPGNPTGDVRLFVRPHHLRIVPAQQNALKGTVTAIRRQGPHHRLTVMLPSVMQSVEVECREDAIPAAGAPVYLKPEKWRMFANSANSR
jgi:sulfate/thiosulfate transport system ATP-binding protein